MTATIREAVRHIVHPGPRPSGWAVAAALTLGVVGMVLAILIVAGTLDGRPAKHFGEGRAGTFLSAALLLGAGALCGAIASDPRARPMRRFWIVAGIGFSLLTYDELGMGHEKLNRQLHLALGWDRTHWLTTRIDDLLVLLYGAVAAWWAFRYRHNLLRLRWAASTMTLAGVGFLLMVAADLTRNWQATEETFKIAAEALIVVALLAARLERRRG